MKKGVFYIFTGMLILSMIGFAVADEESAIGANANAQANAAPSLSDSQGSNIKSNTSEAKAQLNSSSRKTKEEKISELKKQAEEKIAEVRAKIAEFKEKNEAAEKVITQANQLLGEADKLFVKENFVAAIATAKTALARLELSANKRLEDAEKKLEERAKVLKEKEDKLKNWDGKLKQRIEKVESRLQELERFAEVLEKRQGKLNVEGRNITINKISREKREIIAGKINATLGLNITGEEIGDNMTALAALLSNGKLSPVKIMPDKASLNALEKLKARCEKEKCSVELKEVGNFEKSKAVYVVKTEKNSRIFFLFPKKMVVEAEVDAATGEVISIKKPWWSFTAREKNAAEEEIKADVGAN